MTDAASNGATCDTSTRISDIDIARRLLALCPEGLDHDALLEALDILGTDAAAIDSAGVTIEHGHVTMLDPIAAANIAASIPMDEGVRLHRALERAIHATTIDLRRAAPLRARHLESAGDHSAAIDVLVESATLARAHNDTDASLDALDQAIDIARRTPALDPLALLERRAVAATDLGSASARAAWAEVALLHEGRGDTDAVARARYFLFWASEDDPEARGLLDAAAATGAGQLGWPTRAAALAAILEERYLEAIELDHLALRIARRRGDRRLETLALLGLAASMSMTRELTRSIELQQHAVALADELDDRRSSVLGQLNLMAMLLDGMRPTRALEQADSLLAWIDRRGAETWRAEAHALRSTALVQLGRIDEALAAAAAAHRTMACASEFSRALALLQSAYTRMFAGRGGEAEVERLLAAAQQCVRHHGGTQIASEATAIRARLAASAGRLDESLELALSIDCEHDDPMRRRIALQLVRYGVLHDRADHVAHALEIAGGLDAARDRSVDPSLREVVATSLITTGTDPDAGIVGLRESIADWTRTGHRLEATLSLLSLGALLARRRARDARATLEQARRELVDMGCTTDAEQARRLLAQCSDDAVDAGELECALFAGLRERERRDVFAALGSRVVQAGDAISGPDVEREPAMLVLLQGQVRLLACASDGRRLTVDLLDPGAIIGEQLALGSAHDDLHAEAVGEVVVGSLATSTLHALIDRIPRLGRNLLDLVAARSRRTNEIVEQLAFMSVDRRLARLLIDLDARYGHPTLDHARMMRRPFTQSELAELVHARRETVNGLLGQLRDAGVIELRRRRLVVLDPDALRAMT